MITATHLKKHNMTVADYRKQFGSNFDPIVGRKISDKNKGNINMGDLNPMKRDDVKEKVSKSIKTLWSNGVYKDRIQGCLKIDTDIKLDVDLARQCRNLLANFQDIKNCADCDSDKGVQVHHIDENHDNFLISNLEPLCESCHGEKHYQNPFVTVTKKFSFAAAHFLSNYDGKCANLHGHEWFFEVSISRRINPTSGMVLDFSKLKKVVNEYIVDVFDHTCLNDYIELPTAENLLIVIWEILMFDAKLKGISSIKIWEAPDSWAQITSEGMLSVFQKKINFQN
jgi:6-pyruvoyltetrahydropterin/6-carboxytetrahydropterin synthase